MIIVHLSALLVAALNFSRCYFLLELQQIIRQKVKGQLQLPEALSPGSFQKLPCPPWHTPSTQNLISGQERMSATSYEHVLITVQHAAHRAACPVWVPRGLGIWEFWGDRKQVSLAQEAELNWAASLNRHGLGRTGESIRWIRAHPWGTCSQVLQDDRDTCIRAWSNGQCYSHSPR